jgi:hypothetical protein
LIVVGALFLLNVGWRREGKERRKNNKKLL